MWYQLIYFKHSWTTKNEFAYLKINGDVYHIEIKLGKLIITVES